MDETKENPLSHGGPKFSDAEGHGHTHPHPHTSAAPTTGAGDVRVEVNPYAVIERYKRMVSKLQEENFALDAALEAAVGEISELRAKVTALTEVNEEPADEPDEKPAKAPKQPKG